jgi:hypothetical protein
VKAIITADDLKQFDSERSWWATIEEIRKNDDKLTPGRYCPHQAEAVEHEKPEVLINRLLELEEEIATDLQDLLTMVAAPSDPYTEEVAKTSPLAAEAGEHYVGGIVMAEQETPNLRAPLKIHLQVPVVRHHRLPLQDFVLFAKQVELQWIALQGFYWAKASVPSLGASHRRSYDRVHWTTSRSRMEGLP